MARRSVRYTFILVLVAFGTCLAAVSGWRYARVSAPVNGPIVLVTIDSLRADRLPVYGSSRLKTPALSALAADGLIFDRAYSHVPQTLPAHAALLSGRLPFETGVRNGAGSAIAPAERLLPEMLRDRGFTTGGVVSSFYLRSESGINQGFTFFDARMQTAAQDHSQRMPLSRAGGDSERVAERWMDSIGTSRAFLFLHLDDPRGASATAASADADPYDARIQSVDDAIGRLVRYLKGRSLYDQATIIVTADHGEGLGNHLEQGHGLLVYNDTLRVPLIIKPPNGGHTGRHVTELVQHVDLVPTVLDLAKAPIPGNLRGRSLAPLFEPGGSIAKTAVYSESLFGNAHFGWAELTTVTDGRYRYVQSPQEELYDHDSDPGEEHNQIETQPDVARRLRETLKGFADAAKTAKPAVLSVPVSQTERELFEALGDVGTPIPGVEPSEPINPADRVEYVEHFRAAARLATERDWPGAIEQYRALTREQPDEADAWMHFAQSAAKGDRPELALDAYKRVIQLSPEFPDAHLGASLAALRSRRYDDARQYAQKALEIPKLSPPATSTAHELLARVAIGRRDFDLARTEAQAAEDAVPSRPVVSYVEGRVAFEQKRYADALAAFEPALAAVDKAGGAPLADLRLLTAEAMIAVERFSDAEGLFTRELEDNPQSARAKTGLTTVLRSTGRRDEAASLTRH